MTENFICEICVNTYPDDQRIIFDGQTLCTHCLNAHTIICHECDSRIWSSDNAGNEYTPLCSDCYEDDYTHCCRCGTLLCNSSVYYEDFDDYNDHLYCCDCYNNLPQDKVIHDYYYKPDPVFYGDGTCYFGVELEVDKGGESEANASEILDAANRNGIEHLYIKHDGSLNNGFELVTHPMTLEYHETEMPWADVLRTASGMGYMSHKTTTCGCGIKKVDNLFSKVS